MSSWELVNAEFDTRVERVVFPIVALLGLEAQRVMAFRLMRLAAGGALAESEASRMITEKVEALGEAQTAAVIATMKGRNGRQVAKKGLGVYKKRVRGKPAAPYQVSFEIIVT
jgi:hypothetical protein